jgi:hypothetical protein
MGRQPAGGGNTGRKNGVVAGLRCELRISWPTDETPQADELRESADAHGGFF